MSYVDQPFFTSSKRTTCDLAAIPSGMRSKPTVFFGEEEKFGLPEQARRMRPRSAPMELDPVVKAVQFLRGASSRAGMCLPAYYLYLGSIGDDQQPRSAVPAYSDEVLRAYLEFSSINTISVICRKVFDHDPKGGLTGGYFGSISDQVLNSVAAYWADKSGRPIQDARLALCFLRAIFKKFSLKPAALLDTQSSLGRRIGLLKLHGDRTAAHLSLNSHEFSTVDCAHVVAALAILGSAIHGFDDPSAAPEYFDAIDEAGAISARQLFPGSPDVRLFQRINVGVESQRCWQGGLERGLPFLERLLYVTGWW
jgi:hypothetical protein